MLKIYNSIYYNDEIIMKKGSVHAVYGPIGAGKSTYSLKIKDESDAVLFSLDEWFKKLFFEDYNEKFGINWTLERLTRCKNQIWLISEQVLNMGVDVVLDLGFQNVSDREELKYLCGKNGINLKFYFLHCDLNIRKKRVSERNVEKGNTFSFYVTDEMFDICENMFQMPTDQELNDHLKICENNV